MGCLEINTFHKVNSVTKKNAYPLPRADDMFDRAARAKFFTAIDLQSGYWQIQMDEESIEKTAFTTGTDLWEFESMPFGLCNAPATFQRVMNYITMDAAHAMAYIDDLLIFSDTFEDHLKHIEDILIRLIENGLKIKPTKCEWAKDSVTFLGHIISAQGITTEPKNTEKIAKFPVPKSVKDVQKFLGLTGYYRRFVKNYAKIALPLYRLLGKVNITTTKKFRLTQDEINVRKKKLREQRNEKFIEQAMKALEENALLAKDLTEDEQKSRGIIVINDIIWSDEEQKAFEELRDNLMKAPIVIFPDFKRDFILLTDASTNAIGAVLGQLGEDGKEHAIAYFSKTLNKAQRNYSVTEKEGLAIVEAVKQFRHYLTGHRTILCTDHKPLQFMMNTKDTTGRLIRWAVRLQDLDIVVKYKQGKANANADTMSRIPTEDSGIYEITIEKIKDMLEAQREDRETQDIKKYKVCLTENGTFVIY